VARYRVLVAECDEKGGQGHNVAGALRDSGIEVIYMGAMSDVAALLCAAVQEDADAVILSGVSDERKGMLSTLGTAEVFQNVRDIPVAAVGLFEQAEPPDGLRAVFPPNQVSDALVEWIRKEAKSEK